LASLSSEVCVRDLSYGTWTRGHEVGYMECETSARGGFSGESCKKNWPEDLSN
jgi:hypothetical protein